MSFRLRLSLSSLAKGPLWGTIFGTAIFYLDDSKGRFEVSQHEFYRLVDKGALAALIKNCKAYRRKRRAV